MAWFGSNRKKLSHVDTGFILELKNICWDSFAEAICPYDTPPVEMVHKIEDYLSEKLNMKHQFIGIDQSLFIEIEWESVGMQFWEFATKLLEVIKEPLAWNKFDEWDYIQFMTIGTIRRKNQVAADIVQWNGLIDKLWKVIKQPSRDYLQCVGDWEKYLYAKCDEGIYIKCDEELFKKVNKEDVDKHIREWVINSFVEILQEKLNNSDIEKWRQIKRQAFKDLVKAEAAIHAHNSKDLRADAERWYDNFFSFQDKVSQFPTVESARALDWGFKFEIVTKKWMALNCIDNKYKDEKYETKVRYKILIDLFARNSQDMIRFSSPDIERGNHLHPHVSGSWHHCWWDYSNALATALKEKDIAMVAEIAIDFLQNISWRRSHSPSSCKEYYSHCVKGKIPRRAWEDI